MPTPTNTGRIETHNNKKLSYSESVESLINDINLELDDKSSLEESTSNEDSFGDDDEDDDDDDDESAEKACNIKRYNEKPLYSFTVLFLIFFIYTDDYLC